MENLDLKPRGLADPATGKLSEETKAALLELAAVYRRIHARLVREGYTIRDGKIEPPPHHGRDR